LLVAARLTTLLVRSHPSSSWADCSETSCSRDMSSARGSLSAMSRPSVRWSGRGRGSCPSRPRVPEASALLFGTGFVPRAVGLPVPPNGAGDRPAETMVPERGGGCRCWDTEGWPGWNPATTGTSVADGECLLEADTVLVGAVPHSGHKSAPPGQPNGVSRR